MASRFEQWKKENRLIEADETPTSEAPPSESIDAIRTRIDTMLKGIFDKIKRDLATTFGKDIRGLTDDAKRQAMEYLKKAYINLGGQITTLPPKPPITSQLPDTTTESYYNAAFNKLGRMFHEVAETGSAEANKGKVLGLTNYLDTMRSRIMDMIDKMLTAAKHDHLYQGIQGLNDKLDTHGKSIANKIHAVRGHITSTIGKHLAPPEPKTRDISSVDSDEGLKNIAQHGVTSDRQIPVVPKKRGG
jgi:hypothetical protein